MEDIDELSQIEVSLSEPCQWCDGTGESNWDYCEDEYDLTWCDITSASDIWASYLVNACVMTEHCLMCWGTGAACFARFCTTPDCDYYLIEQELMYGFCGPCRNEHMNARRARGY